MTRKIEVTTLRRLDESGRICTDKWTCQGVHVLADRPGRKYVVLKAVTDADEVAALAPFVGEGEVLGYAADALFEGM
jgi:hypothetical protein